MPSIGPAELFVVFVIALVVLGPKRLPEVGRQVGRMLREFRRATSQVRTEMGIDDITADVRDIRSTMGVEDITRDLTRDASDIKQSFRIDAPGDGAAASGAADATAADSPAGGADTELTAAAGALFATPGDDAAESSTTTAATPAPPSAPTPPVTD